MNKELVKSTGSIAVDPWEDRFDGWFPTIFGRSAWNDLVGDFVGDFDKFFGRDQIVPCDVIQHQDDQGNIVSTEIQYALAGYTKDNVTIEVNGDRLCLTVDKTDKTETTEDAPKSSKSRQYLHKGISHRRIEAAYNLNGYEKDKIEASFENGILSVKLPVNKNSEVKRIEIK